MLNISEIRKDFPMLDKDFIYFDNGATTFKPYPVINAVNEFYTNYTSNIHRGDYDISIKASKLYDDTRVLVRDFINANDEKEIVFTSGASESLNTFAYGYGLKYLKKGDVVLTTLEEHASSVLPWFDLQKRIGIVVKYIPLNEDGTFNLDKYKECFKDEAVKVVSIAYVSNVLGYINPIKDITKIAHDNNAIVSVDGAQAVPHLKIDVKDLDIDFLSFSAHKMCGPSGVGVLYGKFDLLDTINPLKYGGGANSRFDKEGNVLLSLTPQRFEAGTPNIEGVIAFGEAIKYLSKLDMNEIHKRDLELSNYLLSKLDKLDNVDIYNHKTECGIVSFNVKGIFAQDVASYLNANKICVRSGNHCAKILHNVIGVNETIRVSMYFYNTYEEIDKFVEVIKDVTLEKCIGAVI